MGEAMEGVIRVDWSVDSELSSSDEDDYIILGQQEYPALNTDEDIEDEEDEEDVASSTHSSPIGNSAIGSLPSYLLSDETGLSGLTEVDARSNNSSDYDDSVTAGVDDAVQTDFSLPSAHVLERVSMAPARLEGTPADLFSLLRQRQQHDEADLESNRCDLDEKRCEVCGHQAESAAALEGHVRAAHIEAAGPYQCGQCSYTSNYRYHVKRHSQMHLAGEQKPHRCRVCGRGFVRRKGLIIHERTHTGERPYVCRYCERDFSDKSNLLRHIRAHHSDRVTDAASTLAAVLVKSHLAGCSDKDTFACSVCDRRFSANSHLLRHMRAVHI